MPKLESVKKLVLHYEFTSATKEQLKELEEYRDCEYYDGQYTRQFEELNNSILSSSLAYAIKITEKKKQETLIPLGASKLGGLPHLPKSWEWPGALKFYAQLNIADFKKYDLENEFPDSGILYFFDNEEGEDEDFLVLYFGGHESELEIRNHDAVNSTTWQLGFDPYCIFYITDYSEILTILPAELKEQIEKDLQCKLMDEDADCKIFGRPAYWQSEDYPPAEAPSASLLKSLLNPALDAQSREVKQAGETATSPMILLLQNEYGEGHIHFRIAAADLKNRAFYNKITVSYSGT